MCYNDGVIENRADSPQYFTAQMVQKGRYYYGKNL